LAKDRAKNAGVRHKAVVERLREAQLAAEIAEVIDIKRAARFVETTMLGLQVAAKAGASVQELRDTAVFEPPAHRADEISPRLVVQMWAEAIF
jgi:TetR/AcrR family transcriptional repressor of nem operon